MSILYSKLMKRTVQKIFVWPLSILLVISFFQIGSGDVLCIGEDGHIKIETECLPCCIETETICELTEQGDLHDEHDDCNNCSDLSPDCPLWSMRLSRVSLVQTYRPDLVPSFELIHDAYSVSRSCSQAHEKPPTFKSNPLSSFISDTILRC